jgi:hypothetical protein
MLRLRRHRISKGLAAGPAGAQDLSVTLQMVSRQAPSKIGLGDLAHVLFVSRSAGAQRGTVGMDKKFAAFVEKSRGGPSSAFVACTFLADGFA